MLVVYLGLIMEVADTARLYAEPLHPYTQMLLAAIPLADPLQERARLAKITVGAGELPSPLNPPSGCVFHTRCPQVAAVCREKVPALREIGDRQVACHYAAF